MRREDIADFLITPFSMYTRAQLWRLQLALKFAELQYYIVRIGALMSNSQQRVSCKFVGRLSCISSNGRRDANE